MGVAAALVVAFVLLTVSDGVDGRAEYGVRIPNGLNVRRNGVRWLAVGHLNASEGGVSLNAFGEAFRAAGLQWTRALCEADSDGDGFLNGEELGDDRCVWSGSGSPSRIGDISHPGFADSAPSTFAPGAHRNATTSSAPTTASPLASTAAPSRAPTVAPSGTLHPLTPANNFGMRVVSGLVLYASDLASSTSAASTRRITIELANGAKWNRTYCLNAQLTFMPTSQQSLNFGIVRFLGASVRDDSITCTDEALSVLFHPNSDIALTFDDVLRMTMTGPYTAGARPPNDYFEVLFVHNVDDPSATPLPPAPTPVPATAVPTPAPPPTPQPTPVPFSTSVGVPTDTSADFALKDFLGVGRVLRDIIIASGITLIALLLPIFNVCCQQRRRTLRVGGRVGTWDEVYSGRLKHSLVATQIIVRDKAMSAADDSGDLTVNDPEALAKSLLEKKKEERRVRKEAKELQKKAQGSKNRSLYGNVDDSEVAKEIAELETSAQQHAQPSGEKPIPYDDHTWRMKSQWMLAHGSVPKVIRFDQQHSVQTRPPTKEFFVEAEANGKSSMLDASEGGAPSAVAGHVISASLAVPSSTAAPAAAQPIPPPPPPPPHPLLIAPLPPTMTPASSPVPRKSRRAPIDGGDAIELSPDLQHGDCDDEDFFGSASGPSSASLKDLRLREQIKMRMGPGGIAQISKDWKPRSRRLRGGGGATAAAVSLVEATPITSPHNHHRASSRGVTLRSAPLAFDSDLLLGHDHGDPSLNPFDRARDRVRPLVHQPYAAGSPFLDPDL